MFGPFAEGLQRALDEAGNTHTLDDIADAIREGRMQWWPGVLSSLVTQVEDTPRKRVLHIALATGVLREIQLMLPVVLEWAKTQGCALATVTGRPGWARMSETTEYGTWRKAGVIMVGSLTQET